MSILGTAFWMLVDLALIPVGMVIFFSGGILEQYLGGMNT